MMNFYSYIFYYSFLVREILYKFLYKSFNSNLLQRVSFK